METISNMTQAATKAIWGTPSSQEPVSGKTGDVSKGEPYDAGNMGGMFAVLCYPSWSFANKYIQRTPYIATINQPSRSLTPIIRSP